MLRFQCTLSWFFCYIEHLFMFLLPSAYFLRGGKSLFSSSAHFFKKLVCFCFIFLQNCINSLNILDINSVRYIICKYVLSLHRFFFYWWFPLLFKSFLVWYSSISLFLLLVWNPKKPLPRLMSRNGHPLSVFF